MIPRYTREEMGHIWSERNEFDTMLLVEMNVKQIMTSFPL